MTGTHQTQTQTQTPPPSPPLPPFFPPSSLPPSLPSSPSHKVIRATVVQYMFENMDQYRMYFEDEREHTEYLSKMQRGGEWGDELTLKAFCDHYQVVVSVVVSTGQNWYNKYEPPVVRDHKTECVVSYLSPVHYNSVVPKDLDRWD